MPKIKNLEICLPKKESIRKHSVHDFGYECDFYDNGRIGRKHLQNYAYRLLLKNVGKNVDEVYKQWCLQFPVWMHHTHTDFYFWDLFEERYGSFTLEGKIIRKVDKHRLKYIKLNPVKEEYYKLKSRRQLSTEWHSFLVDYFNGNIPYSKHWSEREMRKTVKEMGLFYNSPFSTFHSKKLDAVINGRWYYDISFYTFHCFHGISYQTIIEKGTLEFKKYRREQKRLDSLKRRQIRQERVRNREHYDYYLWLHKPGKKIDEENNLTIERLGFDKNTSFRGEEYHGCKRKKKHKENC